MNPISHDQIQTESSGVVSGNSCTDGSRTNKFQPKCATHPAGSEISAQATQSDFCTQADASEVSAQATRPDFRAQTDISEAPAPASRPDSCAQADAPEAPAPASRPEFSRTERLIGTESQHTLARATVAVFGVGGVGSHCIEALARAGIGHLALIDNDTVSVTNINRQSIAYHSTVGRFKTEVMKERILDINPSAQVDTFQTFVLPDNLDALLGEIGHIDYLIDAIDTVSAKLALAEYSVRTGVPLIASMGTGNKLHGELFEITDISKTSVCPLCRVMRRELKKRGIEHLKVLYSKEQPLTPILPNEEATSKRAVPGSVSFVPPVAGLLIAGEVVRELIGIS